MSAARHEAPALAGLTPVTKLTLKTGETIWVARITAPLSEDIARPVAQTMSAMDPWARYGFPPDRLAGFLQPSNAQSPRFVLREGSDIVGLFALKLGWMFGTYLNVLAVLPAYQGRGIGGAVLDWLDRRARANGDRNQFVVTSAFNTRGLALYQSHGFEPIATMPGLIDDAETEILLRKRFAAEP